MTGPGAAGGVVVLVPAWDRADTVGATVAAAGRIGGVDRVVVVDDGSTDATGDVARRAGADVVRLPDNRGKGAALAAGVAASPDAGTYLLLDADLGASAARADVLLAAVADGEADLAVARLPDAAGRGGFGLVRDLAAGGIAEALGWRPDAPLSGQRAVPAAVLGRVDLAPRFGVEVAMTIDLGRRGERIVEVPVDLEHRHTGRSWPGLRHRAGQGRDVVSVLRSRLGTVTTARLVAGVLARRLARR